MCGARGTGRRLTVDPHTITAGWCRVISGHVKKWGVCCPLLGEQQVIQEAGVHLPRLGAWQQQVTEMHGGQPRAELVFAVTKTEKA